VRILKWLLGKQEQTVATTVKAARENATLKPTDDAAVAPVTPSQKGEPGKQAPANTEVENLRRWRESGQARLWVQRHQGSWNHDDWLALLVELKRSPFWPMNADSVGLVLEESKREWLQRN
jgi:hypothetical protein